MSANDFDAADCRHMARTLAVAKRGHNACAPNPRVGCVLVANGAIVGQGWHRRAGGRHAERRALAQAGQAARGATAYVSLEPCCHHGRTPPCTEALIEAGVTRVVCALHDPDPRVAGKGIAALRAAGLVVDTGVMEAEAATLIRGFTSRVQQGRPFVRAKLAASLDGRTAMTNGDSKWITGGLSRRRVQGLRAEADAILTGIGTVLADDPSLDLRLRAADADEVLATPLRVVLDSSLRMPASARMLGLPGRTLVFSGRSGRSRATRARALEAAGATVESLDAGATGIDCRQVLERLAALGVNEVLVEAGARVNGTLLREGLVDEWTIFVAPVVMGSEARALFDWPGLRWLSDCRRLRIAECEQVGEDLCLTVFPEEA